MATRELPKKLRPQTRSFSLRADDMALDTDKRTLRVSFSSDAPVDMWYGTEVLDHSKGAMRADGARQQNMPLLFNHDMDDLLGVVESIDVENERGYANVRFGKDARGDWAMQQVADGILRNCSFLYRVYEWTENVDDDVYTATDWEPYEISMVTVPADASVGVGRAAETSSENVVTFISKRAEAHRSTSMADGATPSGDKPNAAGAAATNNSPATPVDLNAVRIQAANDERQRVSDIMGIAARFSLGNEFIERHRAAGSTADQVRIAAMDAIEVQHRDAAGIQARESERLQEIDALAQRFNLPAEMVKRHKESKTSIETVRGVVLEFVGARDGANAKPLSNAAVDWTPKEAASYSLRAAILAQVEKDWSKAGFEREVSQTIQKQRKIEPKHGGFMMPTNIPFQHPEARMSNLMPLAGLSEMQKRAIYQVGTASQGGNLVETQLLASNFIEVLRNQTVTGQLGANYLTGLVDNINIPRQASQTQTYWVGESVALTESEATFDQVQLRPHTVGALSKMSRLMLMQATPSIEMLVRDDFIRVLALAIDLAAINGTGSGSQPTGIVNTTNVGSVVGGTNGANWTFDMMVQLYAAVLVANAPQENLAFAINGKTKGYLATLKSSTGQYLWSPTQSIAGGIQQNIVGYRYAVSNQLPYNLTKGTATSICSEAIFGNWQELLIGEWGVAEVMANPYDSTGFTTGDVIVRIFQTVDVGVRHPQSFAACSDGLTPGF